MRIQTTGFFAVSAILSVTCSNLAGAQGGPAVNWTGFYLGIHGGHLKADTQYVNPTTPTQEFKGGIFGAQAGYQFQFNQLVVGAEADWSRGGMDDFVRDGNFLTFSGKLDWMASVRGRIGYAVGNFLPYLTVGRVWTRVEQGSACPAGAGFGVCALTGQFNVSSKETFTGWIYGGGVEYALPSNWSLKVEALWTKLSDQDFTATIPVAGTVTTPVGLDTSAVVRAGLNFRF